MSAAAEATPLCPVTGKPAVRLVQWVVSRLLVDLWRIAFGVDARGSFAGVKRFGLWELPIGLYFFDPPQEGDHEFYSGLFAGLKRRRFINAETVRQVFLMAAMHVPAGARVLDVGCGLGGFRGCVAEADYTGLDPHMAAHASIADVRSETLAQHLVDAAGGYDVVCCFEVVEHVRDPKALFAELVEAAKPGGLVCVSVPRVPSAMTRIPNFLINAPPHHLTWWTDAALRELAKSAGARCHERRKRPVWKRFRDLLDRTLLADQMSRRSFPPGAHLARGVADLGAGRDRGVEAAPHAEN